MARHGLLVLVLGAVLGTAPQWAGAAGLVEPSGTGEAPARTPIQHVIILFQENQSFDSVFGRFCQERNASGTRRCNGVTTGKMAKNTIIPLKSMPDIVPHVEHNGGGQILAINGGLMNGFQRISGCAPPENRCYTQLDPARIPNEIRLARNYTISDRTFEMFTASSWMSHYTLLTARQDGFAVKPGYNPLPAPGMTPGLGWGCRANKDADWTDPVTQQNVKMPSCIPMVDGSGPYRKSRVAPAATILDRMDAAGVSWRIDSGESSEGIWAGCPTIAQCEFGPQKAKQLQALAVIDQATRGRLPNVSFVMPTALNSQHNGESMALGDNWIGRVVGAAMNGPEWSSTAIFITYDDCGCFYDHVPPPAGSRMGLRVPMVIVSPYAKRGFTDSTTASFASMLSFIEHNWGLPALNVFDRDAYDYRNAFSFAAAPRPGIRMVRSTIPEWERRYIAAHPGIDQDRADYIGPEFN